MAEPTNEREHRPGADDQPVMGDHTHLETEDPFQQERERELETEETANPMMRWGVPALIVLVIVVIILAFLIF